MVLVDGGHLCSRQRWAVCTTTWHPDKDEMGFLMAQLDAEEGKACKNFVRFEDKKRAVLSRLMARALAAAGLGLPFQQCRIARTRGRKPFLANAAAADDGARAAAPNFNFNVSHEGDYVVGVSEPVLLCGVDVSAPPHSRSCPTARYINSSCPGTCRPMKPFLAAFEDKLTPSEWKFINAPRSETEVVARFLRFWSMKEAFVKGRGDGLQFPLGSVEFRIVEAWQAAEDSWPKATEAQVYYQGQRLPEWRITLETLGQCHAVSVARGPPRDIQDIEGAFRSTFLNPEPPPEELARELAAPQPPFEILTTADLLPHDLHDAYEAAGGELL